MFVSYSFLAVQTRQGQLDRPLSSIPAPTDSDAVRLLKILNNKQAGESIFISSLVLSTKLSSASIRVLLEKHGFQHWISGSGPYSRVTVQSHLILRDWLSRTAQHIPQPSTDRLK